MNGGAGVSEASPDQIDSTLMSMPDDLNIPGDLKMFMIVARDGNLAD
jgi:hypothetical protein